MGMVFPPAAVTEPFLENFCFASSAFSASVGLYMESRSEPGRGLARPGRGQ